LNFCLHPAADSSKPEIAAAQKYFAIQTRKMEKLERLIGDQRRIMLRNRVKDRNQKLASTAKEAGVKRFGIFHAAGIREMYRMRLPEIKIRKGIGEKEDWLDRQGIEELAANEFRITRTDAKIRRETFWARSALSTPTRRSGAKLEKPSTVWETPCLKICPQNRRSAKLRSD
jgi:hypothetical protein